MLRVEFDGPVARFTLARPEVRNAFNDELIQRLHQAFVDLPKDARVVVISGEGDAFCAGGDLQWMRAAASYSVEQNYQDALNLARLFEAMVDCPAPIIARVQGPAFGGGCGVVAAADIAVASEKALFAFSEVRLGLIPATISRFVIPKIGQGHARALFTTGEAFKAEKALRIGLIHEQVAEDDLDEAVAKKVKLVLAAGPQAVGASKQLAINPPESLSQSARLLANARAGEEASEGVAAFLEKRKASFVVEP